MARRTAENGRRLGTEREKLSRGKEGPREKENERERERARKRTSKRQRERERGREQARDEERTIGAVVLYVETLIGVTCSETSYRRVALIFRGSYMPVEGGRGGRVCVAGGTCSTQRLMPRTHVVFHDGNQPAVRADAASSLAH